MGLFRFTIFILSVFVVIALIVILTTTGISHIETINMEKDFCNGEIMENRTGVYCNGEKFICNQDKCFYIKEG